MILHFDYRFLFIVFAGGVIHLLMGLLRSSGAVSPRIIKRLVPVVWCAVCLCTLMLWIRRSRSDFQLRVACLPAFSGQTNLEVTLADILNETLREANPEACLAYPLDWSLDCIPEDSLSNLNFLLSYGRRIGLTSLLTVRLSPDEGEGWMVDLSECDLSGMHGKRHWTALLKKDQPERFFENATIAFFAGSGIAFQNHRIPIPQLSVWEDYGNGRYFQLMGDFNRAEVAYRSAVSLDSASTMLLNALASILIQIGFQKQRTGGYAEGYFLEGRRLLNRSLILDSLNANTHGLLGNLYVKMGRWNSAESALLVSHRLDPNNAYAYYDMARLHPRRYHGIGLSERKDLLHRALDLNPAFEAAYVALAEDYYFRNKPEEVEKIYDKLLTIHPNSLEGLLGLGKLYVLRNDVLNIIRIYERVIELAPEYTDAYYNLGIAYYNAGRLGDAIRFFETAIELGNHVESHYYLGLIYDKMNETERAIEYFRRRIRLKRGRDDPFAEEARKNLVRLLESEDEV